MILFVTGTDTGVGKTVVAAALARAEREAGRTVAYWKPAQTGLGPGEAGDAAFVAAAAGVAATEGIRLGEALAPAVAAERAGVAIDVEALAEDGRRMSAALDVLVVEGAGGLLSPLAGDATMADLAGALGAEVVIVVRAGLGTLNHTALTLEAARVRGLAVSGLVVSGWPRRPGVVEATNLIRLKRLAPLLGVVPHLDGLDTTGPPGDVPEVLPPPRV